MVTSVLPGHVVVYLVGNVDDVTSCQGMSDLSLLMSEMRRAFQVNTPLYARCPAQAPPLAGVQASQVVTGGGSDR